MTNMEAIRIAEEEIGGISSLLDCSPQIYDNPGMRKIYGERYEWLFQLFAMAKEQLKVVSLIGFRILIHQNQMGAMKW